MSWYVCDRASSMRAEPNYQSVAGCLIDEAVGALVMQQMSPAAIELALEIRTEVETRQQAVEQLRAQAIERAQLNVDLAQRRYPYDGRPQQSSRCRYARSTMERGATGIGSQPFATDSS